MSGDHGSDGEMPESRRRRSLLGAVGALAGVGGVTGSALAQEGNATEDGNATDGGDGTTTVDGGEGDCLLDSPGLVTVESEQSFDETVDRIQSAIEGNDALTLVTTVNHAANAESAGMDLPPTTLFVFGNPELGTPLMQASRSVAVDLPQKMVVWEDEGTVYVTYNDPEYLAARHEIEGQAEQLSTIADALRSLATGDG